MASHSVMASSHSVMDSWSMTVSRSLTESGSTMASQSMTIISGSVMISYGRSVKDSHWSMTVISQGQSLVNDGHQSVMVISQ